MPIPATTLPDPFIMRQRGRELLEQLHGGHAGEAMMAEMAAICPAFVDMTIDWALGGVMARPGLDLVSRHLVVIAACVTLGNAQPQLRAHVQAALTIGATREQIVEAILQVLFYAGGAAVRNALVAVKELIASAELEAEGRRS